MVLPPRNGLSLCAGGGGLDMGLMLAEPAFHTRCCVEWEAYPRQCLIAAQQAGYFAPAPIWDDVTNFDGKPLRGAIDTVLAGYPCQPFSHAGKRQGKNDERHLWPDIARIIQEVQPSWVILENVDGHVTLGAETVLRELWDMGFTLAAGLFTAAETGAPHKRQRWFCVARSASNAGRLHARSGGERQRAAHAGRNGGVVENASLQNDTRKLDSEANKPAAIRSKTGETKGWKASEREWLRNEPGHASNDMADTDAPRSQGQWPDGGQKGRQKPDGHAGLHGRTRIFPPSPNDTDEWCEVLRISPDLAPSASFGDCIHFSNHLAQMVSKGELAEEAAEPRLRRMVAGLSTRTRALKLLGNGVVPIQAAYAIRTLLNAHGCRRVDMETAGCSGANSGELV